MTLLKNQNLRSSFEKHKCCLVAEKWNCFGIKDMHTIFSVFQKFASKVITEADVQEDSSNQSDTFHFTRVDHMTQIVHPEIYWTF